MQALCIQTSNGSLKQQTLFFTSLGFIPLMHLIGEKAMVSLNHVLSGLKLNLQDPESPLPKGELTQNAYMLKLLQSLNCATESNIILCKQVIQFNILKSMTLYTLHTCYNDLIIFYCASKCFIELGP